MLVGKAAPKFHGRHLSGRFLHWCHKVFNLFVTQKIAFFFAHSLNRSLLDNLYASSSMKMNSGDSVPHYALLHLFWCREVLSHGAVYGFHRYSDRLHLHISANCNVTADWFVGFVDRAAFSTRREDAEIRLFSIKRIKSKRRQIETAPTSFEQKRAPRSKQNVDITIFSDAKQRPVDSGTLDQFSCRNR